MNLPPRTNNSFNKAQLTPIKNDSIEKMKSMNAFTDDRKRKVDRLDPIELVDSRKKL